MNYRYDSLWNDKNELLCLLIFKKLEAENFPRGKAMDYCRDLSKETGLTPATLSAKVGNYKSVAGVTSHSNASINTVEFYRLYSDLTIKALEDVINKL